VTKKRRGQNAQNLRRSSDKTRSNLVLDSQHLLRTGNKNCR